LTVPCVAIRYYRKDKAPLENASGWPRQLVCNRKMLKLYGNVSAFINEPTTQWCVRFYPVDANGIERHEPRLVRLIKGMVEKSLAFEIDCNELSGPSGKLWGMESPRQTGISQQPGGRLPGDHYLIAVFRPTPVPVTAEDDTMSLMAALLG
jgi:hypothetical protein